jgi:alcohol dehydrogenase class IV
MRFEFATANQIVFGAGTSRELSGLADKLGRRSLVITGVISDSVRALVDDLQSRGLMAATCDAMGEPSVESVSAAVRVARGAECDLVIGIGGGSAIDTAKAVAALAANGGELIDYLEVIGQGKPLAKPSLPVIAVPTTAGTGAEVTRNAVLYAAEQRVKVSLRSPTMLPRIALVDPELTYSMPAAVTASTGLDALTQCMEPYVSGQANPLTDALAREGLMRAARALRRAYENGQDVGAREDMAIASLCGGLALANARLGAVHGFAGVLGGMYPAPHGTVCARLLPYVMETNVRALAARAVGSPYLARYDDVARLVTGRTGATAADGVAWVQDICAALHVPGLKAYGVTQADFGEIVVKSQAASSMKGNPIVLSETELTEILRQAL